MKLIIDDRVPSGCTTITSESRLKFQTAECVIDIRNAYKKYGKGPSAVPVLCGLNMNVPQGVIYTLIGASGCGKTTLFSCLIGRRKLDSGSVKVLGEHPGTPYSNIPGPRVGFMPQETALFNQFTVKETLRYYGALNGVDKEDLEEKIHNLLALLELVDSGQLAKTLSGGQARRLSLAATLIHDPELVILDEPTVGIDPLVRERIWDYLKDYCKSGKKTIIISTHYIEEAQKADYVAMMRKGIFVSEADRAYLQEKHNEMSLEKIFLNLSKDQDCEDEIMKRTALPDKEHQKSEPKNVINDQLENKIHKRPLIDRRHINVLLRRNFLFILRSLGVMGFILGGYTITVLCFCIAIGGIPNYLNVAVANLELTDADRLAGNCPFNKVNCTYEMLSCKYLQYLDDQFNLVYFKTPEEAYQQVHDGKAWISIYFTGNFSLAYETKVNDRQYVDDWTLFNSEIKIRWDGTSAPLNHMMRLKMHQAYQKFLNDMERDCDLNARIEGIPMHYEKPVYGSYKHNFRDYPAPGFLLTNVFFFAVASTACAFISERTSSCVERSFANGINPLENMMAQFLPQFLLVLTQTLLILYFGFKVFGLTHYGSLGLTGVLMLLSGICGIFYGAVIAHYCNSERSAYYITAGSFLTTTITCDIMWTSYGLPPIMRAIFECLPFMKAIDAMRSLMYRNTDLSTPEVFQGFLHLTMWIGILLIMLLLYVRSQNKL